MTPRKLKVLWCTFSYGGNGSFAATHPDVMKWLLHTIPKISQDPRIEAVNHVDLVDTPIPMLRNRTILEARKGGYDLLGWIDSDQRADMLLGQDSSAKPFWDSSFEFLYRHWDRGPALVGAPYCGPPPYENVYAFRWNNEESDHATEVDLELKQFTRYEASIMTGIQPVAALPTGLILFDTRVFDITAPKKKGDKPWCYYEYTDIYETQKASTEDVTLTRDLSLTGTLTLGYNPVYCNWDAWVGHWKPKCVGKPVMISGDGVTNRFAEAARERAPAAMKFINTEFAQKLESRHGKPT